MKTVFNSLLLFSRVFVGSLFIVSGMIKANDPTGFSYKMEEYFSEGALGWTFFEPYALAIAALICIAEIVLGFAVLFGGKPRLTAWLLLLMIVFFTGLTFYTATCNPLETYSVTENGAEIQKRVQCVTDCGCFGDALKGTIGRSLTPWESFYKDIILFVFIGIIFAGRKKITLNRNRDDAVILVSSTLALLLFSGYFFQWMFPVYFSVVCFILYILLKKNPVKRLGIDWSVAIVMLLASTAFSVYCIRYLPVKDFTAYAVGSNLKEKMNDGVAAVYENDFLYKHQKTGEEKWFKINDTEWQNDTLWKFKDRRDRIVKPGKLASISGFNPERDYEIMSLEERKNPHLKAVIDKGINEYYLRYMAIEMLQYGTTDTIDPADYDPAIYPDSAYRVAGQGEKLLDPNRHFNVDYQTFLLETPGVVLFTILHAEQAYTGSMTEIRELIKSCHKEKIPVYILTASGPEELLKLEDEYHLNADYLVMDETELKIVVRSNPGLIILKKGVVSAKWSGRALPGWKELKEKL